MPLLLNGLSCSSSSSPSSAEVLVGFMCGVLFDLRSFKLFCSEDRSIRILFLLCPGSSILFLFTEGVLSGSFVLLRFSEDCGVLFSFFETSLSFVGAVFLSFAMVSCSRFQLLDSCVVFPGAISTIPGMVLRLFGAALRRKKCLRGRDS